MNTEPTQAPAVAGPVELPVRPYATSVTWRNSEGGSWQQWHDEEDPIPTEWEGRPPDEVVHVYTAAQVADMLAAERERLKGHRLGRVMAERMLREVLKDPQVSMRIGDDLRQRIELVVRNGLGA